MRRSDLDETGPPKPPGWIAMLVVAVALAYVLWIAWIVSRGGE
jgi:uncharacterized membrane protein